MIDPSIAVVLGFGVGSMFDGKFDVSTVLLFSTLVCMCIEGSTVGCEVSEVILVSTPCFGFNGRFSIVGLTVCWV